MASAGQTTNRAANLHWNDWLPPIALVVISSLIVGALINWQPFQVIVVIIVALVATVCLRRPWLALVLVLATLMPVGFLFRGVQFGPATNEFNAVGLMRLLVVLLTIGVLLGQRFSKADNRIRRARLLPPVAVFAAAMLIATIHSPNQVLSLRWLVNLLTPVCLYILAALTLKSSRQVLIVLAVYIAASLAPLAVAIPETLGGGSYVGGAVMDRVVSLANHPNEFAAYLVALLLTIASIVLHVRSNKLKIMLGALLCIGLGVLVYTFTRIAWASFIVGLLVLMLMARSIPKLLMVSLFLIITLTVLREVFPQLPELLYIRLFQDIGSPEAHVFINDNLWELFLISPIFGHGLYSTPQLLYDLAGLSATPHNDYLGFLAEAGIVGLASYVLLITAAVRMLWREMNGVISPLNRALNGAAMALLAAMLLFGLTDGAFNYMGPYVCGIIGLAEVQGRIDRATRRVSSNSFIEFRDSQKWIPRLA